MLFLLYLKTYQISIGAIDIIENLSKYIIKKLIIHYLIDH